MRPIKSTISRALGHFVVHYEPALRGIALAVSTYQDSLMSPKFLGVEMEGIMKLFTVMLLTLAFTGVVNAQQNSSHTTPANHIGAQAPCPVCR